MRILVVEDDASLAQAVCAYLRAKSFAVDSVGTLDAARTAVGQHAYAAVLLDLHLPDGEGLSLLHTLNAQADKPVTIVLTARDQVSDRIRGLDAGADDYLVKPYDPEELLARLRAIQRRLSRQGDPQLLRLGQVVIDFTQEMVRRNGAQVVLTSKEWALLRVMAQRPDRIHTREVLQNAIYGLGDEVGSNTLDVFVSRLRRKLGKDLIQTLRGSGYRLHLDAIVP